MKFNYFLVIIFLLYDKEVLSKKGRLRFEQSIKLDQIDPDFRQFYDPKNSDSYKQKKYLESLKSVSYVKKLSNYAKEQLSDQEKKKNSFLVGKPLYFESGLLFDDTPQIYSQTQGNKFTGINIPQSDITVEKHDLWNNKEHMASKSSAIDRSQIYKDVYYQNQDGKILNKNKFQKYDQISSDIHTNVLVKNSHNSDMQNLKDQIISDTINPIKYQLFTQSKINQVKIQNEANHIAPPIDQLTDSLDKDLDSVL